MLSCQVRAPPAPKLFERPVTAGDSPPRSDDVELGSGHAVNHAASHWPAVIMSVVSPVTKVCHRGQLQYHILRGPSQNVDVWHEIELLLLGASEAVCHAYFMHWIDTANVFISLYQVIVYKICLNGVGRGWSQMKVRQSEMIHYFYEAVGTCGCCDVRTRVNFVLSLI